MDDPAPRNRTSGGVLIALTLLGWSSVPLFLKYFTGYIDAWTANGWRYGVSALFWSPVLLIVWRRRAAPARLWRAAVIPSIINCAGQSCFAWAPYYIDPGLLTFMLRFQIIFVALGAFVLFPSERRILRSWSYWVGVGVVFLGSLGTCLLGNELPRGATAVGIVIAVFAGILFGGYSLSVRYFMEGIHPVTAFATISHYTAAGLVVIMLLLGRQQGLEVMTFTRMQWMMLVGSAIVGIALSHVFYYGSIARLGVAVSAGVMLLQPFLTGTGSWIVFGEKLTPAQWIAGVVAVGGAIVMLRVQQSPSSTHKDADVDDAVLRV